MNKIEYALKLAKDCTYADEMMESAKEHLRNVIDEALKEVLPQADVSGRSEQLKAFIEWQKWDYKKPYDTPTDEIIKDYESL
jgi:uncharacterized protein HemY